MASSPKNNYLRMATWPIPKLILTMAFPTILAMLVQSVYSMADVYFVGQIPLIAKQSTAAVSLVGPVFILIQAVGLAFGMGGGSYISRLLGQGRGEDANRVLSTCFHVGWAVCLALLVLGEIAMHPLMRVLGATEDTLSLAIEYAQVTLIGAPIMACCFVMNNALRAEGNVVFSTIGMTSGALLNIVLDPICIHALGMGVRGAAVATVFSQLVSMLILYSFYARKRSHLTLALRFFSPTPEVFREVFRIGIPTFLRNILGAASAVLITHAANPYGTEAVAGLGLVTKFSWVVFSILLGFAMAYMPVCGFNYGAKLYSRVRQAYGFALRVGITFMSVCGVLLFLFAAPVASALHSDPAVSALGEQVMRAQALTYPLLGWGVLINMLFESLGRGKQAAILSLGRQGLFLMAAVLILPRLFGLGGLIAAQPVADLLFVILAVPMSLGLIRELNGLKDDPIPFDSAEEPATKPVLAEQIEAKAI